MRNWPIKRAVLKHIKAPQPLHGTTTDTRRVILIAICITIVTTAHWCTPRDTESLHLLHVVLRKLYILPVVLSAVWFDLRGALVAALAVTVLYVPHVFFQWRGDLGENFNQFAESGTIWAVALITGVLGGRERTATSRLAAAYQATVSALVSALDAREHSTERHSERVCAYALRLAREFGVAPALRRSLAVGALLHDVGKIGVPDSILMKPGPLTDDEWLLMRQHPESGARIVGEVPSLDDARNIVLCHHERFDGSGYPRGLVGAEIPLDARIFAVADTLDALTSVRPYRSPVPYAEARRMIEEEAGSHFDPGVLEAFRRVPIEEWERIRQGIDR